MTLENVCKDCPLIKWIEPYSEDVFFAFYEGRPKRKLFYLTLIFIPGLFYILFNYGFSVFSDFPFLVVFMIYIQFTLSMCFHARKGAEIRVCENAVLRRTKVKRTQSYPNGYITERWRFEELDSVCLEGWFGPKKTITRLVLKTVRNKNVFLILDSSIPPKAISDIFISNGVKISFQYRY